jgi:hypothetical protein
MRMDADQTWLVATVLFRPRKRGATLTDTDAIRVDPRASADVIRFQQMPRVTRSLRPLRRGRGIL